MNRMFYLPTEANKSKVPKISTIINTMGYDYSGGIDCGPRSYTREGPAIVRNSKSWWKWSELTCIFIRRFHGSRWFWRLSGVEGGLGWLLNLLHVFCISALSGSGGMLESIRCDWSIWRAFAEVELSSVGTEDGIGGWLWQMEMEWLNY